MKPSSKVLLVVGGYLAAVVIAYLVVSVYIAATGGMDRQIYSGMFAFGDIILFLGVFVLAAIPASGAALFFLRPYPAIWRALSVSALAIAATGVAALAAYLIFPDANTGSWISVWSGLSPLRFMLAPPLAVIFVLSALFAPTRASRVALLCAGVIEVVVFVWIAFIWFLPYPAQIT
jgi:hypothetical protein